MNDSLKFLKELMTNEELGNTLQQLINSQSFATAEDKVAAIVKFAKEKGYETTEEEFSFEKAKLKSSRLTEEELQETAGGEACCANYNCAAVWNCCVASNECYQSSKCAQAVSEACRAAHNDGAWAF